MNRIAVFFLLAIAPALAIVLALLGLETLRINLLGWFLLITGVAYCAGIVIVYWIRKDRFWESKIGGSAAQEEQGDRSFWLIIPGMLAVFYLPPLELLNFAAILPRNGWMQAVGLALVISGCVLFVAARRALRSSYAGHLSVKEDQPLVQNGPYSVIRHPAYASYLLMALGLAWGYSSLAGLIGIVFLLLPGLVYRIRTEERFLAAHFGEQFRQYAGRTARLIPGIW